MRSIYLYQLKTVPSITVPSTNNGLGFIPTIVIIFNNYKTKIGYWSLAAVKKLGVASLQDDIQAGIVR